MQYGGWGLLYGLDQDASGRSNMLAKILSSLRFLWEAMTTEASAQQIALGCSLGIVIGILPKSNLMVALFVAMLFVWRVNLAAGLVCAAIFSFLGPAADPLFHHVGDSLLTITPLQGLYRGLSQLPIVAWTHVNNTVVAGATFLGLLQLYPTYRLLTLVLRRRETERHSLEAASG